MLDPNKVAATQQLMNSLEPGTDAYVRAQIYQAKFALRAYQVLKTPSSAKAKEQLLDMTHDQFINQVRNLVNPIVPDAGPVPEVDYISDDLVRDLLGEWLLLVGAVGLFCQAWDTVKPIGWVATNKAEPGIILDAVKRAKALYTAIIPFTR